MTRIPLSKKILPDKYWLVYVNENGDRKHIDLSGCAGSFARNTGYVSEDGLRAVGWRYEEQDQVCYELFNVGHTVVFAPKKPGLVQTLGYMLSGKKPEEAHEALIASFEAALNRGGWKTVEREGKRV